MRSVLRTWNHDFLWGLNRWSIWCHKGETPILEVLPMDMFKGMPIREAVETVAKGFCAERYKLDNPGCSEDAAWNHARRYWRDCVAPAIQFIAECEAMAEAERAGQN